MDTSDLKQYLKDYMDFPGKGVIFRDISPLLADPNAFSRSIDALEVLAKAMPSFDKIVAIDARGFIFGTALALRLNKGLILCRKSTKLPGAVVTESYGYEYAASKLSIQRSAVKPGERLLLVDDVLASGNTLLAAYKIIKKLEGHVAGVLCFVELDYLKGRELLAKNLKDIEIKSVLHLDA